MREMATVGLPARRIEIAEASRARRVGRTPARCRSRAAQEARCRHTFYVALAILLVFAGAGIVRVALTTEATRAAFAAAELQDSIKAERLEGDMLEIDKSSLSTPSRIEAVACATMQMSQAADVRYLHLPSEPRDVGPDDSSESKSRTEESADADQATTRSHDAPAVTGSLVRSVLELAADEAQVLLVGDVGLSSSR